MLTEDKKNTLHMLLEDTRAERHHKQRMGVHFNEFQKHRENSSKDIRDIDSARQAVHHANMMTWHHVKHSEALAAYDQFLQQKELLRQQKQQSSRPSVKSKKR